MKKVISNNRLINEWNYSKNNSLLLDPNKLSVNSHTKAWWICDKGHEWQAAIANRYRLGRGCPYCAHQIPIKGETDLEATYPNIAKEWHIEKNVLLPNEVFPGSNKKAWWICDKGHEWQAIIKSRTNGSGCPYCTGKKVMKGFNDFESKYPEVAKEWHPTKNGTLTPDNITYSSGKKVWWKCKFGHEWETAVYNRIKGSGCPKCSSNRRTSFPEQAIYYYIKKLFPDALSRYKEIFNSSMELDIYIPSIKTGIEYDGIVYHSNNINRLRDVKKYNICKNNGITLFRIKEMGLGKPHIFDCDYRYDIPNAQNVNLNSVINNLCFKLSNVVVDVDVGRDRSFILKQLNEQQKSLAELYPEIANEWDIEKNNGLKPEQFPPHSNEKVYWKCKKCNNSWAAAIGDRTRKKATGCPVCAAKNGVKKRIKSIIKKNGCFYDRYPELLDEWDYNKNKNIEINTVTAGSGKKVWWKCKKCGYEWKTSISHRIRGNKCPLCSNKVIIKGINDLTTKMPGLMDEWDYTKNLDLDPTKLSIGCGKKAWWKCRTCGHKWQAVIASRTKGSGCPNFRKHGDVFKYQIEFSNIEN